MSKSSLLTANLKNMKGFAPDVDVVADMIFPPKILFILDHLRM